MSKDRKRERESARREVGGLYAGTSMGNSTAAWSVSLGSLALDEGDSFIQLIVRSGRTGVDDEAMDRRLLPTPAGERHLPRRAVGAKHDDPDAGELLGIDLAICNELEEAFNEVAGVHGGDQAFGLQSASRMVTSSKLSVLPIQTFWRMWSMALWGGSLKRSGTRK